MQEPLLVLPVQMLHLPAGTSGQHVTVAAADCTRRATSATVLNMTASNKDIFDAVVPQTKIRRGQVDDVVSNES